MSAEDKANNKIEDLNGKAKEGLGKLIGDDSTNNEGKLDQAKASIKDAGEKVKDAFKGTSCTCNEVAHDHQIDGAAGLARALPGLIRAGIASLDGDVDRQFAAWASVMRMIQVPLPVNVHRKWHEDELVLAGQGLRLDVHVADEVLCSGRFDEVDL